MLVAEKTIPETHSDSNNKNEVKENQKYEIEHFDAFSEEDLKNLSKEISDDQLFQTLPNESESQAENDSKAESESNAKTETKAKAKQESTIHRFLNDIKTNIFLGSGDALSALTDFVPLPEPLKEVIDKYSVRLTKAVMIGRYIDAAVAAFKENRIVESVGRMMGVAALPLVKLNDLTLASGLGEFIPQLDLALEGKMKERTELDNLDNGSDLADGKKQIPSKMTNLKNWFSSLMEAYKEIIDGGFGKNRKVLPDFGLKNLGLIAKNYGRVLQGKEPDEIKSTDKGHTLVFAGTLTFIGSFLGILVGRKSRDLANKVFGTIRSVGGIIADYSLLTHPDSKMRKAGCLLGVNTVIDESQRFMDKSRINTVNHLNIILAMLGSQIINNRSHEKEDDNITAYSDDKLMQSFNPRQFSNQFREANFAYA
ncbi:MAG: hypothetical protein MK033_12565 [Candidatus Caenarcaniphilales bacterium]|nr:hypothetical protein [Candidatus Caenarcaniphilales bacterium]